MSIPTQRRSIAAFPLLRKELVEKAARPRTSLVRRVYALLFFTMVLWAYYQLVLSVNPFSVSVRDAQDAFQIVRGGFQIVRGGEEHPVRGLEALGKGDEVFSFAVYVQWFGVLLFMPAMMCGLITEEKERGTLPLLLLTDLPPPAIIVEKFLGGLIPMCMLLLLTLPVGGFAYFLGGLNLEIVMAGSCVLLVSTAMVGAVALMVSAYARSTAGAFLGSYAVLGMLYWLPFRHLYPLWTLTEYLEDRELLLRFVIDNGAVVFGALIGATLLLTRRAVVPVRNRLGRFFEWIDRMFHRLNKRFGGIKVIADRADLPGDQPILWREQHRRQLGKLHYQIRYLLLIELVVIAIGFVNAHAIAYPSIVIWITGGLVLTLSASGIIPRERRSQSLDVLLTTRLTGAQIVREKVRALQPLVALIAAPLLTLANMRALFELLLYRTFEPWLVVLEIVHVVLILNLFIALGLAVGLGARTPLRALLKATGLLALWSILPIVLMIASGAQHLLGGSFLVCASPLAMIVLHHLDPNVHVNEPGSYIVAIAGYLCITLALRAWCRSQADRLLRSQ